MSIIQVDGDIVREKQIHCVNSDKCPLGPVQSAAFCQIHTDKCPIEVDEKYFDTEICHKVDFLKSRIDEWIPSDTATITVKCIPFDSSEAWIVAAFDKDSHGEPELILKPAETVIGRTSTYHGYKVKRKDGKLKKTDSLYANFLVPKLCQEWSNVKALCSTAQAFQVELEQTVDMLYGH